jgi:hypothetical protein
MVENWCKSTSTHVLTLYVNSFPKPKRDDDMSSLVSFASTRTEDVPLRPTHHVRDGLEQRQIRPIEAKRALKRGKKVPSFGNTTIRTYDGAE